MTAEAGGVFFETLFETCLKINCVGRAKQILSGKRLGLTPVAPAGPTASEGYDFVLTPDGPGGPLGWGN